ncbi:hypothetical protein IscW_ISCW012404 [Ixodes scapularis]|uniref:Endonuclease/exonuclease/phosphatase domain-containing protein n=1 Tax=Ixodes scapularis TaxID=6945 RepID=B7QCF7_IXOSC|nr:hypothetical protein IscW_ISCW012404 [Ixodes scapularis]|eukprot:XP_002413221.1 hypothetical protein IscW_ISCW012404 [Ixodes scapularis]
MLDPPGDAVLGGAFNSVFFSSDRSSSADKKDFSAATLSDLLRDNDLVVVTSKFPRFTPQYKTWQRGSHASLDRIYFSNVLLPRAGSYDVAMVPFSDHGLAISELRGGVDDDQRMGAPWKRIWSFWSIRNSHRRYGNALNISGRP